MKNDETAMTRRTAAAMGARALAAIAITVIVTPQVHAADAKKKKGKASKEDFFYQEEPGENGKKCENCVNFEPTTGDKGTCGLLEGEVCKSCFCQGWTDKKTGKKAGA